MKIRIHDIRAGLRNSTGRLPFRYGRACLLKCPRITLRTELDVSGSRAAGFSSDCLPPAWFDKSPDRTYEQQINDMLRSIQQAMDDYRAAFAGNGAEFFPTWLSIQQTVHQRAHRDGVPDLLASFGSALVERACLDAIGRGLDLSFHSLITRNRLGIVPNTVHPELAGLEPSDWLPAEPRLRVFVRHTVGILDPLTSADVEPHDRLNDGLPQTLDDYLQTTGLRYFKIKLAGDHAADLARLNSVAVLLERWRGTDFQLTIDGNEQFASFSDLRALLESMLQSQTLRCLLDRTLAIEQPLPRAATLAPRHANELRRMASFPPVIIDEADGTLTAGLDALDFGYGGLTCKSCKGVIKSVLNAGLVWSRNSAAANRTDSSPPRQPLLLTCEDLSCAGVVSLQGDLCLAATLGMEHVERNSHHYLRGLDWLPPDEQAAALQSHPDLYHRADDHIAPRIQDGAFEIASLQCAGLGCRTVPDMDRLVPCDDWRFESLQ